MEPNVEHVYKVVSRSKYDQFQSASVMPYCSHCLFYNLNQETKPKIGKIFVFKELEMAHKFLERNGNTHILLCKYTGEIQYPQGMCYHECIDSDIRKFWSNELKYTKSVPDGTIWVDSVTPIEIVYIDPQD